MPFDKECVEIHRGKFEANCSDCSVRHNFSLQTIQGIDSIASMITFAALENPGWQIHEEKVKFVVRFALYETCLNAIEHGILQLGEKNKKRMRNELASQYEKHIEAKWQENGKEIDITCCVHFKRILIGVHDHGDGYEFAKDNYVRIPESDLLEPSGRGLAILRKVGFSIYFNEAGNTILCSFRNPSYQERRDNGGERREADRRSSERRETARRERPRRVRKSL